MTSDQIDALEALIRAIIRFDATNLLPDTRAGRFERDSALDELNSARQSLAEPESGDLSDDLFARFSVRWPRRADEEGVIEYRKRVSQNIVMVSIDRITDDHVRSAIAMIASMMQIGFKG